MRDVIIACDFKNQEELFKFLEPFKGENPYLKIGMELFYKEGPELVKKLHRMGFKIFLDLKLHDIPNTVKAAMAKIGELGVDITNVHAEGGIEMMKAAKEGKIGIEIIVYCLNAILVVHNIFSATIGNVKSVRLSGEFLWPYVRSELENNGYTISNTLTCNHYFVSWN